MPVFNLSIQSKIITCSMGIFLSNHSSLIQCCFTSTETMRLIGDGVSIHHDDDDDELMLNVLRCHLTYQGQVVTNAEARFNKIHIRKVYACLAVTCHLHFWQNDRDFLRATVVTRGWNGYRNKSQHRKSTLEKKILPPFQQGFEPATFQSRVRCSNHWAIPAPFHSSSYINAS